MAIVMLVTRSQWIPHMHKL